MIIGVGIDVVDVARFGQALDRTPRLRERLFTDEERDLGLNSLAARFAAKEALAKALGAPAGLHWSDATVLRGADGRPHLQVRGTVRPAPTTWACTTCTCPCPTTPASRRPSSSPRAEVTR